MKKTIRVIRVIAKGIGYAALGILSLALVGFYAFMGWGFTAMAYEDTGLGWMTILMATVWILLLLAIVARFYAAIRYPSAYSETRMR